MDTLISIGFALLILAIVLIIFIRISRKVRRGGSGATIATLGSLYDLHNKDSRRAIETIVEINAGKKMEEQKSSGGEAPSTDMPDDLSYINPGKDEGGDR